MTIQKILVKNHYHDTLNRYYKKSIAIKTKKEIKNFDLILKSFEIEKVLYLYGLKIPPLNF